MNIEVRDAATVMLLRDGDGGLEVFMLRRRLQSDFVGGAYVFPGGAVDPPDRVVALEAVCAGRSDAEASQLLGVDRGGLAFWVAAVRECFEEAGVLLAYDRAGGLVRLDDPAAADRFSVHRRDVDSGARTLAEVCRDEGLRLAVDGMHFFSHWITPEGPPRRYDTRFFVARAPDGQEPLHDGRETITGTWITPDDALDRHRAGEFDLIFPTIRSLVALSRFAGADEALTAAAEASEVPTILPRLVADEGGGVRIVLPGDDDYETAPAARWPADGMSTSGPVAGGRVRDPEPLP